MQLKNNQRIVDWVLASPDRAGFFALSPVYLASGPEFSVGGWMWEEDHKEVI